MDNSVNSKPTYHICPCKNETPESLHLNVNTKALIIAIHGTYAKHAEWTYRGKLANSLLENPDTQLSRFCWSGGNSHSKRLKAGTELAEHIRNLSKRFPSIDIFLVSHSHGGNVAMYALKNLRKSNEINRVKRVITLATPFIHMKLRRLNPWIIYSSLFITLLCTIDLILSWKINTNYLAILIIGFFATWLLLVFTSIIIYRNRITHLWEYASLLLGIKNSSTILKDEFSQLELEQEPNEATENIKYLIIRPVGDEATMALIVPQFLSWSLNYLLTLSSIVSVRNIKTLLKNTKDYFVKSNTKDKYSVDEGLLEIIRVVVLMVLSYLVYKLVLPNISTSIEVMINELYTSKLDSVFSEFAQYIQTPLIIISTSLVFICTILICLGFISIMSLILMVLSSIPLGRDALFWSHFAQTTVESSPPGSFEVYHPINMNNDKLEIDNNLGLTHSNIYTQVGVIKKIKGWLHSS